MIVFDFVFDELIFLGNLLVEPKAEHVGLFAVLLPFGVACILLFWEGHAGHKTEKDIDEKWCEECGPAVLHIAGN